MATTKKQTHRAQSSNTSGYERSTGEPWWPPGPIVVFTGLLALFTLLLVVIAAVQVLAFLESERAFIVVDRVGFNPNKPIGGAETVIDIVLKNGGKGAAVVTELAVTQADNLRTAPIPGIYNLPVIGGGIARYFFGDNGKPIKFSDAEINAIQSNQLKLYVYGFLEYRDHSFHWLFGNTEIRFCYVSDPEPSDRMNFSICPTTVTGYATGSSTASGVGVVVPSPSQGISQPATPGHIAP